MTQKTAALLLLFATGFFVTGVTLTGIIRMVDGTLVSGPWLPVLVGAICQTSVLFVGRRYILPRALAQQSWRTAVLLATAVVGTLTGALLATWVLQTIMGWVLQGSVGHDTSAPSVTVPLWLALLWWTVRRQDETEWAGSAGSR